MIRAIAVDDEPLALKVIEHYCRELGTLLLEKTFTKTNEALSYINKNPIDLLFFDIQMPGKNGIELYKAAGRDIPVIFTTAYSQYAVDGFNINATDYLLKPFSKERFETAIQKAEKEISYRKQFSATGNLLVRADYKLHNITIDEIILIEGLDDYIRIHLNGKPPLTARFSMKGILEKLPPQAFIRVHRSYIIPVRKIATIQNKTIRIGSFVIPIGETYKEELNRFL